MTDFVLWNIQYFEYFTKEVSLTGLEQDKGE